jgi:hypothetical protein
LLWNTYEAVSENGLHDGIRVYGIPKKKRSCSWGEYDDTQKKTIRFWGAISSHIHTVAYSDPRIDILIDIYGRKNENFRILE